MRRHDKEVNLLYLGLCPLLKVTVVQGVRVGMCEQQKHDPRHLVQRKHRQRFFLQRVPQPAALRGACSLLRRAISVGVSHFVNEDYVCLHKICIVPRADVVGNHKTRQLIRTQVLVSKERSVSFMPVEKEASINVCGNHDRHISKVGRAQRNAEKDDKVVH